MINEEEIIYLKAKVFQRKNIPVHVKFKIDAEGKSRWKNGWIKEVRVDFFRLEEFKEGDKLIFFLEVRDLTEFIPYGKRIGGSLK